MAGKTIEDSKLARRWDHDQKLGRTTPIPTHPPKGKVSVKVQGVDGHAYFMSVDAEQLTAPLNPPDPAFAGIAELPELPSDPLPGSTPECLLDDIEYLGWLAVEEEFQHITITTAAKPIILKASNISSLPQIPVNSCPFWLDTGASVHISPNQSDFATFQKIPARPVKGLGGSSVMAIGIGDIKMTLETGTHIMLKNALYIPNASV